eukprot:14507338-Alexandrium_andersonii.AAC.1
MRANAAIRLNLQSAMQSIQNRFRRSNLESRGPKNDLNISLRGARDVDSTPLFAQIPNPSTKQVVDG